MRKGTLKKALALALTGAVLVGAFAGCGAKEDSGDKKETKKIVIGASPSPHADILKVAKKELKKEGYELEIKEYSDYVQPNTALESGDLDANYFQHKPYLDDFNKQKKTHLVSAGTIHYEPFGIFPGKTKTLKALKNGATVAVLGGELGDTFDQIADYVYSMDKGWNDMQYSAIIGFIGQLLGYYIADSKNLDADSPRHLTQAIVLK